MPPNKVFTISRLRLFLLFIFSVYPFTFDEVQRKRQRALIFSGLSVFSSSFFKVGLFLQVCLFLLLICSMFFIQWPFIDNWIAFILQLLYLFPRSSDQKPHDQQR